MKRNHAVMIGPNSLPIEVVPACWNRNSTAMIAIEITMSVVWLEKTPSPSTGIVRRPSTAEVMATAGVRIESARNAAPPSMPGTIRNLKHRLTIEYSAKMPPSPWLSAFMAMSTYLTVVMSASVQMTSDSIPKTMSSLT